MGEGFVVMQSNDVDIYYYQDEPGTLTNAQTHKNPQDGNKQTLSVLPKLQNGKLLFL